MKNKRIIHQPSSVEEGEEKIEIPVLPQEIMVEILSRLPVKSLCQFRCVSKQWLSLISDPHFVKSHLQKTLSIDSFCSQRKRVIISSPKFYTLEYESIGRFDENLVALELDFPFKGNPNGLELLDSARDGFLHCESSEEDNDIFGFLSCEEDDDSVCLDFIDSCNGLVCVALDEDTLFLFNPTTRESKRIPDPPSVFNPKGQNVYGFGFDFVNDDYKVVKVGCGTVCVYSLRTDSWRMVCSFPYRNGLLESGVFLNGAIHWTASYGDGENDKYVVAAFCLEEEVFTDMPAPDIVRPSVQDVVGVLDGCLCVLQSHTLMHDDFWVMTEYGVGESWTKLTLSLSDVWMKPLCMAQNREALLLVEGELLLYNLEDDDYQYLVVDGIPGRPFLEAVTYLETLVSPNGFCRT